MVGVIMYIAVFIFIIGLGRKVIQYASTPAPLKIPTTPAPVTRPGVALRMLKEVVFFQSLFKASKFTWIFGWLFHAGLFFVLLCHLRLFTESVWWWVAILAPFSRIAGFVMVAGLIGLLCRRLFVDRVKAISAPSDYLMLVLILLIAGSGLLMRIVAVTDLVYATEFARGLVQFELSSFSGSVVIFLHLLLVAILLIIFPFSKLLHAPGVFFSPSRNQTDNSREQRYVGRDKSQSTRGDTKANSGNTNG